MSRDLVSVIIPAYRRVDAIERAVRSALDQNHAEVEVVVVDDHSEDGTVETVEAIGDGRVTVLAHPQNRGGNAARRTAIEHSRGRYLAFLDADDVWFPDKLSAQLERLAQVGPISRWSTPGSRASSPMVRSLRPVARLSRGWRRRSCSCPTSSAPSRPCSSRGRRTTARAGSTPPCPRARTGSSICRVNRDSGIACVPRVLVRYWRGDHDPTRISSSGSRVAAGHARDVSPTRPTTAATPPRRSRRRAALPS